jgi:predicted metal-dependent TIM-barrel fold hydrolase
MSTSIHVVGFRKPDEKFKQMKSVWDACKAANVQPPDAVIDFFNDEQPDDNGVEVGLTKVTTNWSDDMREGFELKVADIPASVHCVRFYVSY